MFKNPSDFEKLCFILGYQFRNPKLLAKALTTRTAALKTSTQHQEQFEFFGDTILRMAVDNIIRKEFPYYSVEQFSLLRDNLIRNDNLIRAGKKIQLIDYIKMDSNQEKQYRATEHPKILADTMEAIIYAMYLDSRNNLQVIENFILTNSKIGEALEQHRHKEMQLNQPLFDAIAAVDVTHVETLLSNGLNPNSIHTYFYPYARGNDVYEQERTITALQFALEQPYSYGEHDVSKANKIFELLLKYGADVNFNVNPRDHMLSFLLNSSRHENFDQILELVFKSGFDLSTPISDDYTCLALAIIHQNLKQVILCLKYKADPNESQNRQVRTALHLAASINNLEIINQLIIAGANALLEDKQDQKPFDLAKELAIKKILLKQEIIEYKKARKNKTAPNEIKTSPVSSTTQKSEDKKSLEQSASLLREQLHEQLIANNLDETKLDASFYHLGSIYFHLKKYKLAKPLLERAYILRLTMSGDHTEKTNERKKRLDECNAAILVEQEEKIKQETLLWESNRNTLFQTNNSSIDNKLFDPIHPSRLEELLNAGADVYSTVNGETLLNNAIRALHNANSAHESLKGIWKYSEVSTGHSLEYAKKIFHLLLSFGANPNQKDKNGDTALHIAAKLGEEEIIMKLINAGADPTIKNNNDDYASHVAADNRCRELILLSLNSENRRSKASIPEFSR